MKPKSLKTPHRPNRHSGLSYAEVLVATVIVSLLLIPALRLTGSLGRSRRNTLDQDTAQSLALDMIREIKQKSYRDPAAPAVFGPEADETTDDRTAFDDVDDYHDWQSTPPRDPAGNTNGQYGDLSRSVTVRYVSSIDFSQPAADDQGFKEVVITVSRNELVLAQQTYVIPHAP